VLQNENALLLLEHFPVKQKGHRQKHKNQKKDRKNETQMNNEEGKIIKEENTQKKEKEGRKKLATHKNKGKHWRRHSDDEEKTELGFLVEKEDNFNEEKNEENDRILEEEGEAEVEEAHEEESDEEEGDEGEGDEEEGDEEEEGDAAEQNAEETNDRVNESENAVKSNEIANVNANENGN